MKNSGGIPFAVVALLVLVELSSGSSPPNYPPPPKYHPGPHHPPAYPPHYPPPYPPPHAPAYPAPHHPEPYHPAPHHPAPHRPEPYHPEPYHPEPYHPAPHSKEETIPYAFSYGVADEYSGTNFGQSEESDGNIVKGTYSVDLPDGRKQTVNYQADHYSGYQADVSYHGAAQYPPPAPYHK